MAVWIFKYKIKEKRELFYTMLFYILETATLTICLNTISKLLFALNSDWYQLVIEAQMQVDPFFRDKADLIFSIIIVMFVILGICILILLFFKCRLELQKINSQAAYFKILGYRYVEWKIYLGKLCNLFAAAVLSTYLSKYFWKCLLKLKVFSKLIVMTGDTKDFEYSQFLIALFFIILTEGLAVYIWKKKEDKYVLTEKLRSSKQ